MKLVNVIIRENRALEEEVLTNKLYFIYPFQVVADLL